MTREEFENLKTLAKLDWEGDTAPFDEMVAFASILSCIENEEGNEAEVLSSLREDQMKESYPEEEITKNAESGFVVKRGNI